MRILATVLALSIGLNITRFFDDYFNAGYTKERAEKIMGEEPGNCACNDADRYPGEQRNGGGEEVSVANARGYVNTFSSFYKTPYKGVFISKKALDQIFCSNTQANGVFVYPAMKDGNPASFTLVIEGGSTDKTTLRKMDSNNSGVFIAEVMCPSICGASGRAE